MEAFEAFAILSSFAVATFFCARWTLGPLARISGNSNARAQFTIADILCVFAQVQVLLGTLLGEWRMHPSNPQVQPLAVLLFVAIVSFWWVSVVLIERAGVRNFWPRVFLLMIGLPVGVLGSAVVSAMSAICFVNTVGGNWEQLWLAPVALLVLGLLAGIRLVIRRIVAVNTHHFSRKGAKPLRH